MAADEALSYGGWVYARYANVNVTRRRYHRVLAAGSRSRQFPTVDKLLNLRRVPPVLIGVPPNRREDQCRK